jgi:hypothetical protein
VKRHDCGTEHATEREEARCSYERLILADLHAKAAAMDSPPSPAQVTDLWAHAREINDEGARAARWVYAVLALGWRPEVGT